MRKAAMNRSIFFVLALALPALLLAPTAGARTSKTVAREAANASLGN